MGAHIEACVEILVFKKEVAKRASLACAPKIVAKRRQTARDVWIWLKDQRFMILCHNSYDEQKIIIDKKHFTDKIVADLFYRRPRMSGKSFGSMCQGFQVPKNRVKKTLAHVQKIAERPPRTANNVYNWRKIDRAVWDLIWTSVSEILILSDQIKKTKRERVL